MKTLYVGIMALALTGAVTADNLENPDLYEGVGNILSTSVQPGIGDSYGGSILDDTSLLGLTKSSVGHSLDSVDPTEAFMDADSRATDIF